MPNFEGNELGMIPKQEWLDIDFKVTRPNDPIDRFFGDKKTNNLIAYWQTLAAEYQIPVMAQFHGFDTVAQKAIREPIDTHNIEKGLIKIKENTSERLRALMSSGVNKQDALYDYVINRGLKLADSVITRTKVAKNELMAYGKVTIKENNLDLTVNYGVPADQTSYTISLGANDDILGQIQDIVDDAVDKGVIITGMMTSKRNITKMRSNKAIQTAINGNIAIGATVRRSALSAYFEDEYGIRDIITNDLIYGAEAQEGADGRADITTARYYPKDKITFFATNPAGKLGLGLWGDPPEASTAKYGNISTSEISPYVYIKQWIENDPAETWTKASGLFMPVLYNPNSLWIATITESDTENEGGEPSENAELFAVKKEQEAAAASTTAAKKTTASK